MKIEIQNEREEYQLFLIRGERNDVHKNDKMYKFAKKRIKNLLWCLEKYIIDLNWKNIHGQTDRQFDKYLILFAFIMLRFARGDDERKERVRHEKVEGN